jgi:anti-sigma B factor antagonist
MGIKIRANQEKQIYIIDLEGDLELADANLLKELVLKMAEKKVERFILNAAKITSIDTNGIGAFIYVSSTLNKLGLKLAIANVKGEVKKVIEKTKLSGYFPIYEELGEAIRKLSP